MGKKIKVYNDYGMPITVNLKRFNDKVVPIAPNSFALLTEDELLYVSNSSKVIENGILRVEEDTELVDDIKDKVKPENVFTKERIENLLKKTVKQIEKELEKIDNQEGLKNLRELAKEKNKPVGYVEAVDARIKELG